MLIDKPCCDFKDCKHHFDGNCMDKIEYERCPYKRQRAEVERMTEERDKEHDYCNHYMRMCAKAKAEAIKEFAERLKAEYVDFDELHEEIRYDNLILAIDNLVKEMTEVSE